MEKKRHPVDLFIYKKWCNCRTIYSPKIPEAFGNYIQIDNKIHNMSYQNNNDIFSAFSELSWKIFKERELVEVFTTFFLDLLRNY